MVFPGGKPWTGDDVGIATLFLFQIPGLKIMRIVTAPSVNGPRKPVGNGRRCGGTWTIRPIIGTPRRTGSNNTPTIGRTIGDSTLIMSKPTGGNRKNGIKSVV
jgi:hypothetical protein